MISINDKTCVELINIAAEKYPSLIALSDGHRAINYKDLMNLSNKVMSTLQRLGVKKGDVVGIISTNSCEFVPLMLGVMGCGAIMLSIDNSLPAPRVNKMLKCAKANFIISHKSDLLNSIEDESITKAVIHLNELLTINEKFELTISTSDPACVFFTSGSTGEPKGILFSHASITHFLIWQRSLFKINQSDKCLQLTRLSFDVILRSILTALISGANLFFPSNDIELTSAEMLNVIEDEKITYFHVVPSLVNVWLLQLKQKISLPSLRFIFFAGEKLEVKLISTLKKAIENNNTTYINFYGPTETVMAKCCYVIRDENRDGYIFPIGKPLPNTTIYIYNDGTIESSPNVEGEIVINTPYRSMGYIDGTETFKKLPHFNETAYFTRDIGYFDNDGNLNILGRKDDQIKINGIRIELGEIDAIINDFKQVKQASTFYDKTTSKLSCYFIKKDKTVDIIKLRQFLKDRLLPEMTPHQFFIVDELIFNNNGKLDRNATSQQTAYRVSEKIKAISNNANDLFFNELIMIFNKVFNSSVSLGDNFFNLGGNSLTAALIVHEVNCKFNIKTKISELYSHPIISDFGDALHNIANKQEVCGKPVVRCKHKLIPEQAVFATYQMLNKQSPAYNIGYCFKLINIDGDKLVKAFNQLFVKYEILQNRISYQGKGFIYKEKEDQFNIQKVYLTEMDSQISYISEQFKVPLNLEKELIKIQLVYKCNEIYLLVILHHSVSDSESSSIFFNDLKYFYNNDIENIDIKKIVYENQPLSIDKLFWKQYLSEYPKKALLSDCRKINDSKSHYLYGEFLIENFEENIDHDISILAKQNNITSFSIYLSLFLILLNQLSNQTDMVVGVPFSNRKKYGAYDNLGCYVKTLPFIAKLDNHITLLSFFKKTFERMTSLLDNFEDINLFSLIKENKLETTIDPFNLYEVFFSYNNSYMDKIKMGSSSLERIDIYNNSCKFPLSFMLNKLDSGKLKLEIEFDTRIFSMDFISSMLAIYKAMLKRAPSIQHKNICEVSNFKFDSLLSEKTTHDVYEENIASIIYKQVLTTPDKIAIVDGDLSFTYDEFWSRVTYFAEFFDQYKVERNSIIAVLLPRSINLIAIMIAAWCKGIIYLPLDSEAPAERINTILGDASPKLIFSIQPFYNNLNALNNIIVDCNEIEHFSKNKYEPNTYSLNAPSYLLYTSGSTGKPKGVLQTHKTIINLFNHQLNEFVEPNNQIVAQCASAFFDVSIQEITFALGAGNQLVIINSQDKLNTIKFWQIIDLNKITVLFIPPALLQLLSEFYADSIQCCLKYIVVAGESLKVTPQIKELFNSIDATLINHYGPTETHVVSSYILPKDSSSWDIFPSIGKPINNCEIFILDDSYEVVPEGNEGELYIAGNNLALGYYKNEFLTHEKFVNKKIGNKSYQMYKTGDLAAFNDGNLYFHGRIDHQINLNGYRIEPGEIEAALMNHPDIKQVYVGLKKVGTTSSLVAYYNSVDNCNIDNESIIELSNRLLPVYMRPAHYMHINDFPLTINGKINSAALPLPKEDEQVYEEEHDYTQMQRKFLEIIKKTIAKNITVPISHSIFHLGMDSLAIARLLSNISNEFHIDITFNDLYQNNSLIKLELFVQEEIKRNKNIDKKLVVINAAYNPTAQQQRIINDIANGQNPVANNLIFAFKLEGNVNLLKLQRAIEDALMTHDIFSTVLESVNNQYKMKKYDAPLAGVDLISCTKDEVDKIIESKSHINLFPFNHGFYRVSILNFGEEGCIVLFVIHHLIFDGTSWQLLIKEISHKYNFGFTLFEPVISYQNYACTKNNEDEYERNLMYLKNTLSKVYDLVYLERRNIERKMPLLSDNFKRSYWVEIDKSLTLKLKRTADKNFTTLFSILMYSYGLAIRGLIDKKPYVVGLTISSRNNADIEKTLGLFIQRSVVDMSTIGDSIQLDSLLKLQKSIYTALSNNLLPVYAYPNCEQLCKNKNIPTPQFNFVFQNYEKSQVNFDNLIFTPLNAHNKYSSLDVTDITFVIDEMGENLILEIVYNDSFFPTEFISNFSKSYITLLNKVVSELGPIQQYEELASTFLVTNN